MPKGSPRSRKTRVFVYVGDTTKSPPPDALEVPKEKTALAPVEVMEESATPSQTPLLVRKKFVGQTRQDIDAINRANYKPPLRLEHDPSSPKHKKIGSCGTVF